MDNIVKDVAINKEIINNEKKSDNIKEQRLSNFELLRIIAMILIILHHYAYHGNLISIPNDNFNKYVAVFIIVGGKVGVNVFVLITGYFLINSKFKIKKVIQLILQVYFYSIVLFLVTTIINGSIDIKLLKNALFFPLLKYWFIKTYLILYMLTPILNRILNKISKEYLLIILIIMFIVMCIMPLFIRINMYNTKVGWFIFMYFIGAYIKLYNVQFRLDFCKIIIIIALYLFAVVYNIQITLKYPPIYCKYFLALNEEFLPILFLSIIVFLCFKSINIKYNKIINDIAKISFAVYLFHDNDFFREYLWNNILHVKNFYNANLLILIGHIIFSILYIYITTFVLEQIRGLRKTIDNILKNNKNMKEEIN